MIPKKVVVIGSGFSSISAATYLANENYEVTILEKNSTPGGRARSFKESGFTFDMGPSWYWMPDVFENYFKTFGKNPSDYYTLKRLDPSYTIIFNENNFMEVPADLEKLNTLFDSLEPGSSKMLGKFLSQAKYKYQVGMNDLVYRPGRSLTEYLSFKLLVDLIRLDLLQSFHSHVRKFFHHPQILQLMEFPVLFLGALPKNTPALYSLMNYADIQLGTWYPMGGMYRIVEAMVDLAISKGVNIIYNQEVKEIKVAGKNATHVLTMDHEYQADIVVGGADYYHVEEGLLSKKNRSYSREYWNSRILAPSSLIFFLGINKKLKNLNHHNLFFDQDFIFHAEQIYEKPAWPNNPLFYVSAPSITDPGVAPEGFENLFILIPVAPGLEDTEEIRETYFNSTIERLEKLTKQRIREHIIFKRSYAHNDFIKDYHAFKGNAYGLANTLKQTAFLKPSLKSKKIKNLYFTGQLTVPGPGVPPSLISGQVTSSEIIKDFK
jgi:phytoene desaturase